MLILKELIIQIGSVEKKEEDLATLLRWCRMGSFCQPIRICLFGWVCGGFKQNFCCLELNGGMF